MILHGVEIPEKNLAERCDVLLDLIKQGKYDPIIWKEIKLNNNGKSYSLFVGNDALKIDGIRITVSHKLAQEITDCLGLIMPTDKISDIIHQNSTVKILPCIQSDSVKNGTMSFFNNTVRHSKEIDKKLIGKDTSGLISTVGKLWITSNKLLERPNLGVNYGWYATGAPYKSASGLNLWQPKASAHNNLHFDYSQVYVPIHPIVFVDGNQQSLFDLLLVDNTFTYEKLKITRHPQVVSTDVKIMELQC